MNTIEHKHTVVAPGNGKFYCLSCSNELTAQEVNVVSQAVCEACGKQFDVADGYYEAEIEPTYQYCKDCCHW